MSDLGPVSPGHAADAAWLRRWRLHPDGDPTTTASSRLIPVTTRSGAPAMLKIAHSDEEERGVGLLVALDGHGAARVLRHDRDAALIERATGDRDLVSLVRDGEDDQATRIICDAAARIHGASRDVFAAAAPLVDLPTWFQLLFEQADELGPVHRRGAELAQALLDDPREPVALHGDLHHGNVLDFGERGWLAIDPKGLVGEAGFDYANLLCNPSHERALQPGRLERQFGVVVEASGLERDRLADWLVAWCALSSTWFTLDDDPAHAESAAAIGELALRLR
ncbi:aminoglycoside phosphotransferase family protein [Agromyces aerolatus]|uniref:aminoglycoside phosphotransferase family protein n=1 Tax=Agromyces sp. LY-1074 TaxID=3074080 RepID=UPI002864F03D|nr:MULTISPECIES: aminoglycoside phosphotransferase family protein [unclassified Agromyces]MDR5698208.1 aminoglycoside phosphotransferase family protein [Agromyces sp. LY-1074]MDR5704502.1 aminoglycoside phosphotransferase family protein [Agromyces sp. LY-1358]